MIVFKACFKSPPAILGNSFKRKSFSKTQGKTALCCFHLNKCGVFVGQFSDAIQRDRVTRRHFEVSYVNTCVFPLILITLANFPGIRTIFNPNFL